MQQPLAKSCHNCGYLFDPKGFNMTPIGADDELL